MEYVYLKIKPQQALNFLPEPGTFPGHFSGLGEWPNVGLCGSKPASLSTACEMDRIKVAEYCVYRCAWGPLSCMCCMQEHVVLLCILLWTWHETNAVSIYDFCPQKIIHLGYWSQFFRGNLLKVNLREEAKNYNLYGSKNDDIFLIK